MKKKSEITEMRLLGPVSERALNNIGVYTRADLEKLGPQKAFKLIQEAGFKPSRNFLYAMEGAIHDMGWSEVTSHLRVMGVIGGNKKKF